MGRPAHLGIADPKTLYSVGALEGYEPCNKAHYIDLASFLDMNIITKVATDTFATSSYQAQNNTKLHIRLHCFDPF